MNGTWSEYLENTNQTPPVNNHIASKLVGREIAMANSPQRTPADEVVKKRLADERAS